MDDMDILRPFGGNAFANSWRRTTQSVNKHGGGSHDQESHGSWAGNGAGGKNIQDMSASDQKEFIDRMSSAKTTEEQRAIIDEFKNRQKGGAKGKKAPQGKDREAMMRDYDKMEAKWRKKLNEKPYDPENEEYGDPQDLASTDFYRKYGVYPDEVPM